MAFISEVHYLTSDISGSDSSTHEFIEIALAPGEDPADFVLSFYNVNGVLMDGASPFIDATGVSGGEVTLSGLAGVSDPNNPGFTIYTVTSTDPTFRLINASSVQNSDEAHFVALTNTSTGVVEDAIGLGFNTPTILSGGAADGAQTTNAPTTGSGESVQFDSAGNNVSGMRTPGTATVACFCLGTQISVPGGTQAVEDLAVGDLVETLNSGLQPIRWLGRKTVNQHLLGSNPKLLPVRICQGSMGNGLPQKDLLVSRQHRMLTSSRINERMFGQSTSLVSAIKLTSMPGISIETAVTEVDYFHILLDEHQVIFAEGTPTESLFLGEDAVHALDKQGREEVFALFPELRHKVAVGKAAAYIPSNKAQKTLSMRHAKNDKRLLDVTWQQWSN